MFKALRDVSEAIVGLSKVGHHLSGLVSVLVEHAQQEGTLRSRVEELERSRERWEAVVEADAIRSDSVYKSARGAEERTRTMRRHLESLSSGEDGEGAEAIKAVRELLETDGAPSAPVGVPDVPEDVVVDPKALGRKAKFG